MPTTPRSSANLVLAIGMSGGVLLNAVIGFAQEHVAERTAEALQAARREADAITAAA